MSDIPSELFHEILRRVPVESLFRFRSVCKSWQRIIDDPAFSKQHIHRGIGGHCFFYRSNKGKLYILPIKDLIYTKRKWCIDSIDVLTLKTPVGPGVPRLRKFPAPSCNGLILIFGCKINMVWRIWNPFTGESLGIGQCDELANVKCGNLEIPYSGLGYDESNDDYKVVRIVEFRTYIYSVNSKEWRRIGDFPVSIIVNENGVFAYGALHWVAYPKELGGDVGWIVALDLSTGTYRRISLPLEVTRLNRRCLGLNALSECLVLSCYRLTGNFFMWKIMDYGCEDTWIEMISLEDENQIQPIAYLKSEEKVLLYRRYEEYLWYDLGKKCSERLGIEVDAKGFEVRSDCYEYIYDTFTSQVFHASLARIKRSNAVDECVGLQGTSKRKRKRAVPVESFRLPLKIMFGDPEGWGDDNGPTFSDESMYSDEANDQCCLLLVDDQAFVGVNC